MLSKNQLKLITSLQQKKYRNKHGLFIAEGVKVVNEFLNSNFDCKFLFCTEDFSAKGPSQNTIVITNKELNKISSLKTPNKVLGVFKIPEPKPLKDDGLIVVLDGVNDPGNLGTIIRLCDWFGVEQLICSNKTVDCYNHKVVQASMGSLARISVTYTNLKHYLSETSLPVYGTFMNGENIHRTNLAKNAILVMGNEANGISQELTPLISKKITIPRFGDLQKTESLNVATATAIILNEFRRI